MCKCIQRLVAVKGFVKARMGQLIGRSLPEKRELIHWVDGSARGPHGYQLLAIALVIKTATPQGL